MTTEFRRGAIATAITLMSTHMMLRGLPPQWPQWAVDGAILLLVFCLGYIFWREAARSNSVEPVRQKPVPSTPLTVAMLLVVFCYSFLNGLQQRKVQAQLSETQKALAKTKKSLASSLAAPAPGFPEFQNPLSTINTRWREAGLRPGAEFIAAQERTGVTVRQTSGPATLLRSGYVPRLSQDRRTLYIKAAGVSDQLGHLIKLPLGGSAQELTTLPIGSTYYDVAAGEGFVIYGGGEKPLEQISLKDVRNNTTTRLTSPGIGGRFPMFSPDAKQFAFCTQRKLVLQDISTKSPDEVSSRVLVDDGILKELPSWSPDGKWITYQARQDADDLGFDVYKVGVADGEISRLTRTPGTDANPCFSRDGTRILFGSERDYVEQGNPNADGLKMKMHIMQADGTNPRPYPDSPAMYFPRW